MIGIRIISRIDPYSVCRDRNSLRISCFHARRSGLAVAIAISATSSECLDMRAVPVSSAHR